MPLRPSGAALRGTSRASSFSCAVVTAILACVHRSRSLTNHRCDFPRTISNRPRTRSNLRS